MRLFLFFSACWAVIVFLYVALFHPYETGYVDNSWGNMSGDQYANMFAIAFIVPGLVGLALYAYRRFVR